MAAGSRGDAERRFWDHYRNLTIKQGVNPTVGVPRTVHRYRFLPPIDALRTDNAIREVDPSVKTESARV